LTIGKECRVEPEKPEPKRVGCLVETVPGRPLAGMMTLAWSHTGTVEQSIFCQVYDLSQDGPDLDLVADHFGVGRRLGLNTDPIELRKRLAALPGDINQATLNHVRRDPGQLDSLVEELLMYDFVSNPKTRAFAGWLQKTGGRSPAFFLGDWESEGLNVISAFILMNSRDLSVREPVTQEKLNRARKRRGKPLLQSHTLIRLGAGRGISRGGSRAGSKAHIVRGHFKIRKGGVFWWSPHVRGDGRIGDREAYRVSA
jgi:hypothetical protein